MQLVERSACPCSQECPRVLSVVLLSGARNTQRVIGEGAAEPIKDMNRLLIVPAKGQHSMMWTQGGVRGGRVNCCPVPLFGLPLFGLAWVERAVKGYSGSPPLSRGLA